MTPEEVVAHHRPLAYVMGRQYETSEWSMDDLAQEAMTALWLEAEKRPGDDLSKLASTVMRSRILKVLSKQRGYGQELGEGQPRRFEPRALVHTDGLSQEDQADVEIRVGVEPSAEDIVVQTDTARWLRSLAAYLPKRESLVINSKLDGDTRAETAAKMGCTPQYVDKVFRGAVTDLRGLIVRV